MSDAPITRKGAGILYVTSEGKALFLKRGPGGDFPGYWCFPGGTTEDGETPEETATREALEEIGPLPKGEVKPHTRTITPTSISESVDFTTFCQKVKSEFVPTLNGEHTGYAWAPITEPPEPIHPGCSVALQRFGWDELGVARAMASNQLTSPQRYANVWLFDLRITGTGVAYRGPKTDDKGQEIVPEEFVYRRPENYLTDEFVARCAGLQVIMMHPAKTLLNSKEFGARTVGAMMLPYIKGDEVWGIAKIYDDGAAVLLQSSRMSTSPAVLLGNGDQKLKTEDGTDLLIEGRPSLLDHLAICERGVWDKGGEPSGVRTDSQSQGDTTMPLSKEDQEALGKLMVETIAASVPGMIKAHLEASTTLSRADDAGGQKLDRVLSAIDAFCGRMDQFGKRMDAHETKMDEFPEDLKKKDKKGDRARKDGESDDDYKKRCDSEDKEEKEKADAEEKEAKEKADAAEKEEKEKADAAKADSDRLVGATTEIAKRLIAVEQAMPKALTDADRHAFAVAQSRADEVYSAFGKRAPYPLVGEDVLSYRKRLTASLKEHSPTWKDVDVLAMADSATFGIAEDMILKHAAIAALHPTDLQNGELRQIVRQDAATGIRTVEFRGEHSFVRGLKRPPRHVKSIGVRPQA